LTPELFQNVVHGKDLNQSLLLPPSLHDWLPENPLARFLVDVVGTLDLSDIHASYVAGDGPGQSAYAPAMMVRVLLYGYASGTFNSRKIQARTFEDAAEDTKYGKGLSGDDLPAELARRESRLAALLGELKPITLVNPSRAFRFDTQRPNLIQPVYQLRKVAGGCDIGGLA
jgi:hypothetical protein